MFSRDRPTRISCFFFFLKRLRHCGVSSLTLQRARCVVTQIFHILFHREPKHLRYLQEHGHSEGMSADWTLRQTFFPQGQCQFGPSTQSKYLFNRKSGPSCICSSRMTPWGPSIKHSAWKYFISQSLSSAERGHTLLTTRVVYQTISLQRSSGCDAPLQRFCKCWYFDVVDHIMNPLTTTWEPYWASELSRQVRHLELTSRHPQWIHHHAMTSWLFCF